MHGSGELLACSYTLLHLYMCTCMKHQLSWLISGRK